MQLKMGQRFEDLNRHFSQEGIQIASKYMKRGRMSLVIRKWNSKPQGDTTSHALGWL